jgi:5-methylcytosine-specific restriction enzyme A
VSVLVQKYFVDAEAGSLLSALGLTEPEGISPLELSFEQRITEYRRVCGRADVYWRDRESRRPTGPSDVPVRSADARRAVLLRSGGDCENPQCHGSVHDVTDKGAPILEVDHIQDIALGGDDNPAQMIALCPNCHATKTRGSTRKQLRAVLLTTADDRHRKLITLSI